MTSSAASGAAAAANPILESQYPQQTPVGQFSMFEKQLAADSLAAIVAVNEKAQQQKSSEPSLLDRIQSPPIRNSRGMLMGKRSSYRPPLPHLQRERAQLLVDPQDLQKVAALKRPLTERSLAKSEAEAAATAAAAKAKAKAGKVETSEQPVIPPTAEQQQQWAKLSARIKKWVLQHTTAADIKANMVHWIPGPNKKNKQMIPSEPVGMVFLSYFVSLEIMTAIIDQLEESYPAGTLVPFSVVAELFNLAGGTTEVDQPMLLPRDRAEIQHMVRRKEAVLAQFAEQKTAPVMTRPLPWSRIADSEMYGWLVNEVTRNTKLVEDGGLAWAFHAPYNEHHHCFQGFICLLHEKQEKQEKPKETAGLANLAWTNALIQRDEAAHEGRLANLQQQQARLQLPLPKQQLMHNFTAPKTQEEAKAMLQKLSTFSCEQCAVNARQQQKEATTSSWVHVPAALPPAPHVCSKCRMARYCSKECQRQHWKQHKILCPKAMLVYQLLQLRLQTPLPASDVVAAAEVVPMPNEATVVVQSVADQPELVVVADVPLTSM